MLVEYRLQLATHTLGGATKLNETGGTLVIDIEEPRPTLADYSTEQLLDEIRRRIVGESERAD